MSGINFLKSIKNMSKHRKDKSSDPIVLTPEQRKMTDIVVGKDIIQPNSCGHVENVQKIIFKSDIPNPALREKVIRQGYGMYDSLYYGEVFDEQWKNFVLQIHPGYNVPNYIKTIPRRWKVIVNGKVEEISEDRKNKTRSYKRYTDYYKEDDKLPYEYPNTVFFAELDSKDKPITLSFETKINDESTSDSKKQCEFKIKIRDASYIPNAGYEDGVRSTYPEECDDCFHERYVKPGFYIIQEIKYEKEGSSEVFKVSEHYNGVEDLFPKKINISVPEKHNSSSYNSFDYYLTEDGKNYRDANGNLISIQEIREKTKEYGFKNPSEGRLARIYRAKHGAKKYSDKHYSIIPPVTKKIIRACERLDVKEKDEQQEII